MKKSLIYILLPLLLTSCFTMKGTRFHVATNPAQVPISSDIEQIKLLNRTRIETNKINEVLATGSLTYQDPAGLNETINGFEAEIKRLKYFEYRNISVNRMKRENIQGFPDSLALFEIKEQYDGDYLLASLEIFETYESVDYRPDTKMQLDSNGNEYYINVIVGQKTITGKTGWRFYNSINGKVLDEVIIIEDITLVVEGIDEENARAKLSQRSSEYYQKLGVILGTVYAQRISPQKTFVGRNYYSKSKSSTAFKDAVPFIKGDDWKTAKGIWQDELKIATKAKDLAKLHFNLGVYYEKTGNLEKAIEHLELAYNQDEKIAKNYLGILNDMKNSGYPLTN